MADERPKVGTLSLSVAAPTGTSDVAGGAIVGADMTSGVETCHRGGNGSNKFWEHGTLASSETNACRFHPDPHASAVGAL